MLLLRVLGRLFYLWFIGRLYDFFIFSLFWRSRFWFRNEFLLRFTSFLLNLFRLWLHVILYFTILLSFFIFLIFGFKVLCLFIIFNLFLIIWLFRWLVRHSSISWLFPTFGSVCRLALVFYDRLFWFFCMIIWSFCCYFEIRWTMLIIWNALGKPIKNRGLWRMF